MTAVPDVEDGGQSLSAAGEGVVPGERTRPRVAAVGDQSYLRGVLLVKVVFHAGLRRMEGLGAWK